MNPISAAAAVTAPSQTRQSPAPQRVARGTERREDTEPKACRDNAPVRIVEVAAYQSRDRRRRSETQSGDQCAADAPSQPHADEDVRQAPRPIVLRLARSKSRCDDAPRGRS